LLLLMAGDASAPTDDRGQAAFEDGNRQAEQGALKEAEEAYRRAAGEGHATAAAYAGVFAESHGDPEQAETLYRQADEGGDGFGSFRLGMLLSRTNRWDAAREAWERADERGQERPPFDAAAVLGETTSEPAVAGAGEGRSAFANPVLLGAVTVLVAIVGVFLAYNANTGLPFVPTRELKVDIPNGSALLAGNQVLAGGYHVGLVSDMRPVRLPNGSVGAQVILQLSPSYGRVPVDSTATISPRSLLGLKYVELHYGSSKRIIPDGGTLPAAQTAVPVQFDDINKLFDTRTRTAVKRDLVGFGDVLAARGSSLNDTFAALPALLLHLGRVAGYLSAPSTELTRFFSALNGFFSTVSPVAAVQVRLFGDQATTFEAISRSASDLENTIKESPPTLSVSTDSLRAQQPFLVDLTRFSNYMRPATASLRAALPYLNPALVAGIKVLPRTPSMNTKLEAVLAALRSLARDPGTNIALNGLTQTVGILGPMVRYLGPFVSVCNSWNTMWSNLADGVSEQTNFGNAQRALIMFGNHQTNNVGSQGATAPANGYLNTPADQVAKKATGGADAEYYHGPAYAAAVTSHGTADCEAGQRGYPLRLNHYDAQGHPNLVTDAHNPGAQGTAYSGLSRVPPGETYSRKPTTGPQLPFVPGNN
jgi:virulence factor Mce-like protein